MGKLSGGDKVLEKEKLLSSFAEDIFNTLTKKEKITEDAIKLFKQKRANAVYETLTEKYKVSPQRLQIITKLKDKPRDGVSVYLTAKLNKGNH